MEEETWRPRRASFSFYLDESTRVRSGPTEASVSGCTSWPFVFWSGEFGNEQLAQVLRSRSVPSVFAASLLAGPCLCTFARLREQEGEMHSRVSKRGAGMRVFCQGMLRLRRHDHVNRE